MQLTIAPGDITATHADAVVNAANSTLLGGGGVDGAIHRRGGPEILAECRRLRETDLPEGLPAGQAVATTAGRLPARWVIHTVGPVWAKTIDKSDTLASCYRESLKVGANTDCRPSVSNTCSTARLISGSSSPPGGVGVGPVGVGVLMGPRLPALSDGAHPRLA